MSFVERRRHIRIPLHEYPLEANFSFVRFACEPIYVGRDGVAVLIENISASGLRFLTGMHLPVDPRLIVNFQTNILHRFINLDAVICWKRVVREELYEYGSQFLLAEDKIRELDRFLLDAANILNPAYI